MDLMWAEALHFAIGHSGIGETNTREEKVWWWWYTQAHACVRISQHNTPVALYPTCTYTSTPLLLCTGQPPYALSTPHPLSTAPSTLHTHPTPPPPQAFADACEVLLHAVPTPPTTHKQQRPEKQRLTKARRHALEVSLLLFRILANFEQHHLVIMEASPSLEGGVLGGSPGLNTVAAIQPAAGVVVGSTGGVGGSTDGVGSAGGGGGTGGTGVVGSAGGGNVGSAGVGGTGADGSAGGVSRVSRLLAGLMQDGNRVGVQHVLRNLDAHCALVAPLVESPTVRPRVTWVGGFSLSLPIHLLKTPCFSLSNPLFTFALLCPYWPRVLHLVLCTHKCPCV